jgi:hypothetical protein
MITCCVLLNGTSTWEDRPKDDVMPVLFLVMAMMTMKQYQVSIIVLIEWENVTLQPLFLGESLLGVVSLLPIGT